MNIRKLLDFTVILRIYSTEYTLLNMYIQLCVNVLNLLNEA